MILNAEEYLVTLKTEQEGKEGRGESFGENPWERKIQA